MCIRDSPNRTELATEVSSSEVIQLAKCPAKKRPARKSHLISSDLIVRTCERNTVSVGIKITIAEMPIRYEAIVIAGASPASLMKIAESETPATPMAKPPYIKKAPYLRVL